MNSRSLKGRNPYKEQVQGRALQSSTVTILLQRAQELGAFPSLNFSIDQVIARLCENAPRVAVIGGSADHTAHVCDYETSLILSAEIWRQGGVPFMFGIPTVCDGTAQSTVGMSYSLLSRNLTSQIVITQMEAHSYHAAVIVQGCDKTPFAILNGLLMLDRIRQKRGDLPVTALFAPVHVLRGGNLKPATRRRLLEIGEIAATRGFVNIQQELLETLSSVLLCTTNQSFQGILERAVAAGLLPSDEKLLLENEIAAASENSQGGICSFNGTGNSARFLMSSLGLVPPGVELLCRPVAPDQVAEIMTRFFPLIGSSKYSISRLVNENLANTIKVHSSLGGSTNLILHLVSAMNYAGFNFSIEDFFKIKNRQPLPDIFSYSLQHHRDIFLFAKEWGEKKHQGVASIIKILDGLGVEMNLGASTITGSTWQDRLQQVNPSKSEMLSEVPIRLRSGIDKFTGNFFSSAVVKISGLSDEQIERFNRKAYVVCYFENEDEANHLLLHEKEIHDILLAAFSSTNLLSVARANATIPLDEAGLASENKETLYRQLLDSHALRIVFVISGQGPSAFGIPEMFSPMQHINANSLWRNISILVTDGRFSGVTQGPAFGHVIPEAYKNGNILHLRTGDLLWLDFDTHQMDVINPESLERGQIQALDLEHSSWLEGRVHLGQERLARMEQRRLDLPPVAWMEEVTDAEYGIVPESVKQYANVPYQHETSYETPGIQ